MNKISIFWFRRDLRLEDNTALYEALKIKQNVLPIFIFDENILNELEDNDPRVNFIYDNLRKIDEKLKQEKSSLLIFRGNVQKIWEELLQTYQIESVFLNKDYEPYACTRDNEVKKLVRAKNIEFYAFKDQVIHEENEILKNDGTPYTIFTPYKNKWLEKFTPQVPKGLPNFQNLYKKHLSFPSKKQLKIQVSAIKVKDYNLTAINDYDKIRDIPYLDSTTYLSPHLRFGTISVRQLVDKAFKINQVFLSELIWREFFMQILFHYPKVVTQNFKSKYDDIKWENNEDDLKKWTLGKTGYPIVDAGMRQLNKTGYMHNRVRMITAGFLCKHLLIDWRWGEAYFAQKLLDYELSSNNGNWQWAAGTGCDAAPYFRIFNPIVQLKRFDPEHRYVKKWIDELGTSSYMDRMIDHKWARKRALERYKEGIK